jgi:hypothetical protein
MPGARKSPRACQHGSQESQTPNYLIVQAIPRIEDMSASDGLWTESIALAASIASEEVGEGIDVFFGRRKVEF